MRKGLARRIATTAAAVAAAAMLLAAPAAATDTEMSSGCEYLNNYWSGTYEWQEFEVPDRIGDPPDNPSTSIEFWAGDKIKIRSDASFHFSVGGWTTMDLEDETIIGYRAPKVHGGIKENGTAVVNIKEPIVFVSSMVMMSYGRPDSPPGSYEGTFEVTCTSNPKRNR